MTMNMIIKTVALTVVALQAVKGINLAKLTLSDGSTLDVAALDRDQAVIEEELKKDTIASFATAKKIYEEGGNSGSYACVNLTSSLTADAPSGTSVTFTDNDSDTHIGTIKEDAVFGDTTVEILYPIFESHANSVLCKVGALPPADQTTGGCIDGALGIDISGTSYGVDAVVNKNYRTLQSVNDILMSTTDFPDLDLYDDFYGRKDFADEWVQAAFASRCTNYVPPDYDQCVSTIPDPYVGRREFIKKGIVYMGTMMTSLKYVNDVLVECKGAGDVAKMMKSIDLAWAYYVGSLQGSNDRNGKKHKFYYALADKRCENFRTCEKWYDEFKGPSWTNKAILFQFKKKLQQFAPLGKCGKIKKAYQRIASLVILSCIQGTLRYALKKAQAPDPPGFTQKEEAEGAVFFASILPFVHDCDPTVADAVFNEMKVSGIPSGNYATVKNALQSIYNCKRFQWWDRHVGGIYDSPPVPALQTPFPGAEAKCTNDKFNFNIPYPRCNKVNTRGKANRNCNKTIKTKPYYWWCPKSCGPDFGVYPDACTDWNAIP